MASNNSPGGKTASWLYGLAVGFLLFSGFAQMPIMKRYYIADVPGLSWTADFFTTSFLHYLAAALLLGVLAWRLTLAAREGGLRFTWGPATFWGWLLLGALVITGGFKAYKNAGLFISPFTMMILDLAHLGAAMGLMMTGLVVLVRGRKKNAPAA